MRIAVVAPGTPITPDLAARVTAFAAAAEPDAELVFHPQCFLTHHHFAGPDDVRAAALIEVANDPAVDAVWFARGGYGSGRIVDRVVAALAPAAAGKTWLGYSDTGYLLAALDNHGIGTVAHGPMVRDFDRDGGDAAVARALAWLVRRDVAMVEPLAARHPCAAFNLTVLGRLLGTPLAPRLAGRVLLIEDVSEHVYAIDRALHQLCAADAVRGVAAIAAGRFSDIRINDPDFGAAPAELVRFWCERYDIPFAGAADIGHDAGNRIVPFARAAGDVMTA